MLKKSKLDCCWGLGGWRAGAAGWADRPEKASSIEDTVLNPNGSLLTGAGAGAGAAGCADRPEKASSIEVALKPNGSLLTGAGAGARAGAATGAGAGAGAALKKSRL